MYRSVGLSEAWQRVTKENGTIGRLVGRSIRLAEGDVRKNMEAGWLVGQLVGWSVGRLVSRRSCEVDMINWGRRSMHRKSGRG